VLGTAIGGPLGGAVGGSLGQVAGGAIGVAPPGGTPAGPRSAPAAPGSPAAAQLLQLISRPEVLQALLSLALGRAGRGEIPVGSTPVPPAAFANLIGTLANQAAAEHHALGAHDGEAVPTYLLDHEGGLAVDPAVPAQRAARLLEVLEQAAREEAEGWDEDDDGDYEVLDLDGAELAYD
jgi:hypothetical protein